MKKSKRSFLEGIGSIINLWPESRRRKHPDKPPKKPSKEKPATNS